MSKYQWNLQAFPKRSSSRPLKMSVITIFLSLLIFIVGSFFYRVDYSITAEGEVTPAQGQKEIFAQHDGILTHVEVEVGDHVKMGQVISRLKIPFIEAQALAEVLQTLRQFYDEQIRNPNPKLDDNISINCENPVVMKSIAESSQAWKRYLEQVRDSQSVVENRLRILNARKEKLQAKLQILTRSREPALLGSLVDELNEQIEKIDENLFSIREDVRSKNTLTRSEALSQLKSSYLQIYDYYDSHLIKSPIDGKIALKAASESKQVQKNALLFSVIADSSEFAIRLKIPSMRISKVQTDLRVRIAVDSYPYQKFGYFDGRVYSIDQIVNERESIYEVRATINLPKNLPRSPAMAVQLFPGMKIKAWILIREMPLIQMIYEKVFLDEDK